jgi:RNA polymerase sigma-70 factor, ECF subfamily
MMMNSPGLMERDGMMEDSATILTDDATKPARPTGTFHEQFVAMFDTAFARIFRFLDRLSADPELAADLAQDVFVRLYRRGAMPDKPEAWLITVALNLFRNARTGTSRRLRLLTLARGEAAHSDPPPGPDMKVEADDTATGVRFALASLSERERRLLLLSVEGFSYRDIASAVGVRETSVGVLIARAKQAFRTAYEDAFHAP